MKIDIHITDATPIEAQRVLMGISFSEEILGKISPAIKIEKAQKPDPTCDEETGCKDCNTDPFSDACGKCNTTTAAKEPEKPERRHRPTGRKPGPRPGTGKGNPYGIPPPLYTEDKQKYQRLWSRCKHRGIKYEEALALEGKTKLVGRHAKKAKAEALIVKESAQAIASSNDVKEPVTVAAPSAIVIGAHVQQTRPDAGRMISGNGVVVGRRGEIVDVRDGGGKVHKILAACLKVVTTPVSDRATGMSS